MSATLRRAAAALRGFLRGFLGLERAGFGPGPRCPDAARRALERRAEERRSCC
ncbi:MAG TPA: hypothetical protein VFC77_12900 [Myxococcota bacterium]|nr:hypothetical protein [Myxococcota bacterium]